MRESPPSRPDTCPPVCLREILSLCIVLPGRGRKRENLQIVLLCRTFAEGGSVIKMPWPGRRRGDGKEGGGGGGEAMSGESFLQVQSAGKLSVQGSSGRKGRSERGPTGSLLIWDFDLNVAEGLRMG